MPKKERYKWDRGGKRRKASTSEKKNHTLNGACVFPFCYGYNLFMDLYFDLIF